MMVIRKGYSKLQNQIAPYKIVIFILKLLNNLVNYNCHGGLTVSSKAFKLENLGTNNACLVVDNTNLNLKRFGE